MKNLWIAGIIVWLWPIIIHSQDGTLDTNFGNNGSIVFPKIFTQYESINAVFDTEGRVLLLTTSMNDSAIVLYRYLSNGLPDPTFGTAGEVAYVGGTNGFPVGEYYIQSSVFQHDQKILLSVTHQELYTYTSLLLRLNEDGSLDPGFGNNGLRFIDLDTNFYMSSLCLLPDQKILISGSIGLVVWGVGNSDVVLIRMLQDGVTDTTFGQMGMVVTDLSETPFDVDFGGPIAIGADGKIVVAAKNGLGYNGIGHLAMMRHLPDGQLDTNFGVQGIFIDTIRSYAVSEANAIALNGTSSILIAGSDGDVFGGGGPFLTLRQFTYDGLPDISFADNGWYTTQPMSISGGFYDMAIQPDHKILAAGIWHENGTGNSVVIRFLPNGIPDPDFGLQGSTIFQQNLQVTYGTDLILYPEGKISLLGYTDINPDGLRQIFLARFNNDFNTSVPDDPNKVSLPVALFPNPSREGEVSIEYALRTPAKISASLFDSYGRLISVLFVEEEKPAGLQNDVVTLPGELASGMYIIRLSTESGDRGSTRFIRL